MELNNLNKRTVNKGHLKTKSSVKSNASKYITLPVPCISENCIEIKIKLNFYYHTSLLCLKRFYEGLMKALGRPENFTKKCENKNLT